MTITKDTESQNKESPVIVAEQGSADTLHWIKVNKLSPTTTEDAFEYFLLSLFPISDCYLGRNNNGFLESTGYFSISEENALAIEGGLLAINAQTHTLDTVDITFEIVDHPSNNTPSIKLFHLPKEALEYDLKREVSKYGTISNFQFTEGNRTARLNLSNPIESKRLVSSELYLNGEQIGVKFAGDVLGNDDVLLNEEKSSSHVSRGQGPHVNDTKLYLTGFEEDVAYEELNAYFSRFGKVIDTNLVSIPNKFAPGMIRYGFLQLEDPEVGRQILDQKYHQIGHNKIMVQHSVSKGRDSGDRRPPQRPPRRYPQQHYPQHNDNRQWQGNYENGHREHFEAPYQSDYQQGGYAPQQWQSEAQPRDYNGYQQPQFRQQGQYGGYNQGYEQFQGYEQQQPHYGQQQQGYGQRHYDQWQEQGAEYGGYQPPQRGYGERRAYRGGRRR